MRKVWSKTETVDNQPRKIFCTINDIKVTLDGKPVSGGTKHFSFPINHLVVLTCTSRFAPWEVVKARLKQPMTTQG